MSELIYMTLKRINNIYPYQDRISEEALRKYGVEIDEELKPKTFSVGVDVIIGEDRKGFTDLIKRVGGEK